MPDSLQGDLTYELVAKILRYDSATGLLFWLPRPLEMFFDGKGRPFYHEFSRWNTRYAGTEAFTSTSSSGYKQGSINGVTRNAHRVIWLLHYGEPPRGWLDHINGVRDDNRIINLRVVTPSENSRNRATRSTSTSGVTGVSWHKNSKNWQAYICRDGAQIRLGRFATLEEAALARRRAEPEHGFHENHGRPAIVERVNSANERIV